MKVTHAGIDLLKRLTDVSPAERQPHLDPAQRARAEMRTIKALLRYGATRIRVGFLDCAEIDEALRRLRALRSRTNRPGQAPGK